MSIDDTPGEIPPWADESLSTELPVLRAQGEGQRMEYMASFPENTHELGKEIAAFATSGGGSILIGVADDGALCGLPDGVTLEGRDRLVRRLEGICNGTVRPGITPSVSYAFEAGQAVLVIAVPRGGEPVYYCGGKPYVRHLSASRPAEPHEVVALVREWLGSQPISNGGAVSSVLGEVLSACAELIEAYETVNERMVEPHFDRLLAQLRYAGDRLTRAAADDEMLNAGLVDALVSCATKANQAANFTPHLGMRDSFSKAVRDVAECAKDLYRRLTRDVVVAKADYEIAKQAARKYARELNLVWQQAVRADSDVRYQDLQDQVSLIGFYVLHLCYGGLRSLSPNLLDPLRAAAREAYLIDTVRLFLDGGHSQRELLERISACTTVLLEVTEHLP